MTRSPAYVPLWCTSVFSFLQGASHPEELVIRAAELGYRGMALTDRDSLGGVVEAWGAVPGAASGEVSAPGDGFRYLIGAEVTVGSPEGDAPYRVLL